MPDARFLEIHTLTPYAASLLNRDDVGLAKRLPFGGAERTRVSSQCLKRHWRRAVDEWSLAELGATSVRSRNIFNWKIAPALRDEGHDPQRIVDVLTPLRAEFLGESPKAKKKAKDAAPPPPEELFDQTLRTEQVIVLGEPEIDHITGLARKALQAWQGTGDLKPVLDPLMKEVRANLAALKRAAGLDAALFGRMVTSDILARGDAAVHVAHAFTVHAEESEPDYFSAVDDLVQEAGELGSGHINTTELTSGLFYSYVVVDLPLLVANLSGDAELAAKSVEHLIHLIATVSPGAKLGSTAPYAYADLMLVEAGRRQPRSLANAFLDPVPKSGVRDKSRAALGQHLAAFDQCYGPREHRRKLSLGADAAIDVEPAGNLDAMAGWAAGLVRAGAA
jgi:CRISPR system Cascade subunit CasC